MVRGIGTLLGAVCAILIWEISRQNSAAMVVLMFIFDLPWWLLNLNGKFWKATGLFALITITVSKSLFTFCVMLYLYFFFYTRNSLFVQLKTNESEAKQKKNIFIHAHVFFFFWLIPFHSFVVTVLGYEHQYRMSGRDVSVYEVTYEVTFHIFLLFFIKYMICFSDTAVTKKMTTSFLN